MNNNIIVLNPDYHFKNDIDRVIMYSLKDVKNDSSIEWIGYIHPMQAMILGLFTTAKPLEEHYKELEKHFKLSYENIDKLVSPYINNPSPIYVETGNNKVLFPKNVLVNIETLNNKELSYDFCMEDLRCKTINLQPDRMHKAPHTLLFMLTNKCVTNCLYCYADRKTKYTPLSTQQILKIIEDAHNLKMSYIDIIGGEIFCRKDWDIILKRLVELNLTPNYISTKVPINKNIIEKLYNTGYRNVVQLSLDSLNEQVLKKIIKCNDGYIQKTLHGIELLQEYGFEIQIDTILTKFNSEQQQLTQLFDYINGLKNLAYWEIRVPEVSIYTPETFADIKADKKTLASIGDFVKEKFIPMSKYPIYFSSETLDEEFHCGKANDECFKGGACGILNNRLFVLPDGKVSICEQLYWLPQFIIGDLTKQTFSEIWNSDKAIKLFNMSNTLFENKSFCGKCNHAEFCNKQHRRCFVKTIKAYGTDKWNYPDPRCIYAPQFTSDLKY